MGPEITFNIEKPATAEELKEFKDLKINIKALLKKGSLRVVEKYAVFSFIIKDYTSDEKIRIAALIEKGNFTPKPAGEV
jgi:hypothetical protein